MSANDQNEAQRQTKQLEEKRVLLFEFSVFQWFMHIFLRMGSSLGENI